MYWEDTPLSIGGSGRATIFGCRACDDRQVRALAAVFALIAVACMSLAIVGMVTGRPGDRVGWLLRAGALACFAITVALNVAAH
jgi:hypothetical protein